MGLFLKSVPRTDRPVRNLDLEVAPPWKRHRRRLGLFETLPNRRRPPSMWDLVNRERRREALEGR